MVDTIPAGNAASPSRSSDGASGAAFASVVAALQPFFDPGLAWSGAHLEHFAYRALREIHPELSIGETYVVVMAARQIYAGKPGRRSA